MNNLLPDGPKIKKLGKRIKGLEEIVAILHNRIEHLEQHSHSEHTIGAEAVSAIASHVKSDIARHLLPPAVEQAAPQPEEQSASTPSTQPAPTSEEAPISQQS